MWIYTLVSLATSGRASVPGSSQLPGLSPECLEHTWVQGALRSAPG